MMTERDHFLTRYVEHDTLIWEYLNSSIHLVWFHAQRSLSRNEPFSQAPYLEKKFKRIYQGDAYKYRVFDVFNFLAWKIILFRFYRLSDRLILNNALDTEMGSSDIDSAMRSFLCLCALRCPVDGSKFTVCVHTRYFRAITEYMQQLRHSLGELRDDIEYDLPTCNMVEMIFQLDMVEIVHKTLSPGRWHRKSWMLLMRKRSPASQSFPSSGIAPSFSNILKLWNILASYLTFDILILQSDHSPLLLLCQECSHRDTGLLQWSWI